MHGETVKFTLCLFMNCGLTMVTDIYLFIYFLIYLQVT